MGSSIAASMKKSLVNQQRMLVPHSGQDVAPISSTQTENESSEVAVLLAILTGLVRNVMSRDVITLALYEAADICAGMGMKEETFAITSQRFLEIAERARQTNPMHKMF
jgi:hypothetical protein